MPGAVSDGRLERHRQPGPRRRGERDGAPTVYVVDPHGNSVFVDVPLPFTPVAAVADTQPDRPSEDRTQLLALARTMARWRASTSAATRSGSGCRAC